MRKFAASVALYLLASAALGHPGHEAANGMGHWLSDIAHGAVVAALAGLAAVIIGGGLALRRTRQRKDKI